jgi:hypothetical protein
VEGFTASSPEACSSSVRAVFLLIWSWLRSKTITFPCKFHWFKTHIKKSNKNSHLSTSGWQVKCLRQRCGITLGCYFGPTTVRSPLNNHLSKNRVIRVYLQHSEASCITLPGVGREMLPWVETGVNPPVPPFFTRITFCLEATLEDVGKFKVRGLPMLAGIMFWVWKKWQLEYCQAKILTKKVYSPSVL